MWLLVGNQREYITLNFHYCTSIPLIKYYNYKLISHFKKAALVVEQTNHTTKFVNA